MVRYYISILIIAVLGIVLPGCDDKDDMVKPVIEGIVFSPIAEYQEAYPGALVSFNFQVRSNAPVTSFKVQFKLPGSPDFADLPEYPELTGNAAAATSAFQPFEYTLPGSATAVNAEAKVKFIAKTADKAYEKIFTVKMLSTGLQTFRIYNPGLVSYFRPQAIDLLKGTIVPDAMPDGTKDMIGYNTLGSIIGDGTLLTILRGWGNNNLTRFKVKTKAIFDGAPSTYEAQYVAGTELTGAALSSTLATVNALTANTYYLAKVVRPAGVTYVGIFVKTIPRAGFFAGEKTQDFSNEYLEIQIKK